MLYFLRERISEKNLELKHLIVTDIYNWYIFDASTFEELFAEDKALVKQFKDFEEARLSGKKTDFFYTSIAQPAIAGVEEKLKYAYFDLRQYNEPLRNKSKEDDKQLIALFKLLSPEHLLKLPFINDSNSLDKQFYNELLHIMGLAEVTDSGRKLIMRKAPGERQTGSIMEDAILQIKAMEKLERFTQPCSLWC